MQKEESFVGEDEYIDQPIWKLKELSDVNRSIVLSQFEDENNRAVRRALEEAGVRGSGFVITPLDLLQVFEYFAENRNERAAWKFISKNKPKGWTKGVKNRRYSSGWLRQSLDLARESDNLKLKQAVATIPTNFSPYKTLRDLLKPVMIQMEGMMTMIDRVDALEEELEKSKLKIKIIEQNQNGFDSRLSEIELWQRDITKGEKSWKVVALDMAKKGHTKVEISKVVKKSRPTVTTFLNGNKDLWSIKESI